MSEAPKVMHLAYHPACDCKVAYQNIPERTGIDKSDGRALLWAKFHHDDTVTALQEQNRDLREHLKAALATIEDYAAYEHDGDPWSEDARAMGEMDINAYMTDGRQTSARAALEANKQEGGE